MFRSGLPTRETTTTEARDQHGFSAGFNSVIVDPKRIAQIIEHLCGRMNNYLKLTQRRVGSLLNRNGRAAREIGETHEPLPVSIGGEE